MNKTFLSFLYKKKYNVALFSTLGAFFNIFFLFSILTAPVLATGSNLNLTSPIQNNEYKQWFAGSILAPNPTTMPPGHPGLELVTLLSQKYGYYNSSWKLKKTSDMFGIRSLVDFQAGFNEVLGVELIESVITNFRKGKSDTQFEDSIFRLGFQLSSDTENSLIPDSRVLFQETFPSGKFQRLSVKKKGIDSTGNGSFQTGFHLAFQKLFHPVKDHDLRLRGSIGYLIPTRVHIKGLSCFTSEANSKGIAYPGIFFTSFLFGEYSLSRRCAIACETNYQYRESGLFFRKKEMTSKIPEFRQFSILPEFQYTYSENFGIVLGGWFTVFGKNSVAFRNIFFAALILF